MVSNWNIVGSFNAPGKLLEMCAKRSNYAPIANVANSETKNYRRKTIFHQIYGNICLIVEKKHPLNALFDNKNLCFYKYSRGKHKK